MGLGVMLLKVVEDEEHPVLYISHQLPSIEKN